MYASPFARNDATSFSSSAISLSLRRRNATLIAVGYESLVDCDMFRSSCGSRIWYSPFLCPVSSSAMLASTSLAFMLVEVPAPPWYQSTRNWS